MLLHSTAESLQCYACSSLNDANCWNVTRLSVNSNVIHCNEAISACTTRITTLNGYRFVGRNCLSADTCAMGAPPATDNFQDHCETCNTDLCNVSSSSQRTVADGFGWTSRIAVLVSILLALVGRFQFQF